MDLNDENTVFGLGQFIDLLRESSSGAHLTDADESGWNDQTSYNEILVQCSQTRQMIQRWPYGLPFYILHAQQFSRLEYPDLSTGSAYKALLLSDAVQDEDDEYHERVVDDCSRLIPSFASEGERQVFFAKQDESFCHNERGHDLSRLRLAVTKYYCPLIYRILVRSLFSVGCFQSAFVYCSRGLKLYPDDPILLQASYNIQRAVSQTYKVDIGGNPTSWPDNGSARRELYSWNTFEPVRTEELSTLNAMMSEVAPKLKVSVVELPDLTTTLHQYNKNVVEQLGVFAKEDIMPGETILTETTILTANNKLRDALCDACSADLPDLGTPEASGTVCCPDCEVVFCSQQCMEKASELYHPAVCGADVETIAKDVPSTESADALYSLLLLRALAMAETQQCHPLELKEVKYIWGDFHNVPIDNFAEAERMPKCLPFSFEHNVRLPYHMLEKMNVDIFANPQYDIWVFNTLYAKFRGTASARLSGLGGRRIRGPEVSAVHPMWCLANHSCCPNVSWDWGGHIKFWTREQRAIWMSKEGETVKMNEPGIRKGEEILNHYCDVELPVNDRREWAKGALGGYCRCDRCVWEAGE